eukprot:gene28288-31396_t
MSPKDAARLLTAFAGNGQPPGSLMAGATLRVIAPAVISAQISIEQLVDALEAVALAVSSHLASTAETDPRLAIRCLSALATCRMPASSLPAITAVLQPSLHQLPPDSLSLLIADTQTYAYTHPHDTTTTHTHAPSLHELPPESLSLLIVALKNMDIQMGFSFLNKLSHEGATRATSNADQTLQTNPKAFPYVPPFIQDMDIPMGFSFLNKLADDVATRAKSNAVQTLRDPSKASTSSDPVHPQVDLEGPVCLYLLATVNHKPGYERVQAMVTALQPHLPNLPAMHLTNTLWALARLGHPLETPWLLEARAAVAHQQSLMLSQAAGADDDSLKPYQLAFIFGSLQSLRCPMDATFVDQDGIKFECFDYKDTVEYGWRLTEPYHLVFIFGSLQSLRCPMDATFVDQSLWCHMDATFVDQMLDCATYSLPAMLSHDVALVMGTVMLDCVAYSLPAMLSHDVALVMGTVMLDCVAYFLPAMLSHDVALVMGTVMLDCVAYSLPAMLPHNVALVMGTVAKLQHVTSYTWMGAVEDHVSLRLEAYSPKELATVVWGMAKLHHRPSAEWTTAFQEGCFEVMDTFDPGNLSTLVWAFAELGQIPCNDWMERFCSTRYQPETEWLSDYLSIVHAYLPALNGQAFATIVKGLQDMDAAVSGREFWDAFCSAMRAKLPSMSPQALVDVASGLAFASYEPSPAWTSTFLQACEKSRDSFSPQELNQLVCSMAQLKAVPQQGLLKNFLNRTPAVLPTLEPASITASASALALFWSLPAEASPCTPDDASPWVEALVQAARGNINSFGLAQLNELTKLVHFWRLRRN